MKSPRFSPTVEEAFEMLVKVVSADPSLPMEERLKAALAEILAPKHELIRRRAEVIAGPIAERHDVSVRAIFGDRRARFITSARDELCAELLARGWSGADAARVLGITRSEPARAASRHQERVAAATGARRRANGA